MVSGRLARSRKSDPGRPEVINGTFDKELNMEMDGYRGLARTRDLHLLFIIMEPL